MPEIRKSATVPQPVNQELLLPTEFPEMPKVMIERFGSEAQEYQDDLQLFWTRTRRVLNDLNFNVAAPVNEMKENGATKNHLVQVVAQGEASVKAESEARKYADGKLSGKYTLTATAGHVVTGMNITSSTDNGEDISEIVFQADRLKVQSSTLPTRITMMDIKTNGIVFGTDIASDNFVSGIGGAGWRLTRDTGILECHDGLFRGAVFADTGLIGGFVISGNRMQSVSLGPYAGKFVVMDPDPSIGFVVGGWSGTAPTAPYAQLNVPAGAYPQLEMWDNTGLHSHVGPDSILLASATESLTISRTTLLWGFGASLDTNLRRYSAGVLGTAGSFQATSFNATSSSRYKRNLRPIEGALQLLLRLQGCRFDWRTKQVTDDIGLIAEDVDAIFPTIVGHDDKGRADSLDYGKLTAVLIEAVREIDGRVNALEHQVARH